MNNQNKFNYSTGRELFFYLLSFFTLAIMAVSLGNVFFAWVSKVFPDELINNYVNYNNLAWPLSALLVTAPIFWLINRQIEKELKAGKLLPQSKVRKVLLYLILLIASMVVIGDVIGLLYRFFNGELSLLFLFKIAIILLLGVWTIWYYGQTLRYDEKSSVVGKNVTPKWWWWTHSLGLWLIVLTALVVGFVLNGGPARQQKIKQDEKTLQDVMNLYYGIDSYYSGGQILPDDISSTNLVVPKGITYKREAESIFLLCANFNFSNRDNVDTGFRTMPSPPLSGTDWRHDAGGYCFKLFVKPVATIKKEPVDSIRGRAAPVDLKK